MYIFISASTSFFSSGREAIPPTQTVTYKRSSQRTHGTFQLIVVPSQAPYRHIPLEPNSRPQLGYYFFPLVQCLDRQHNGVVTPSVYLNGNFLKPEWVYALAGDGHKPFTLEWLSSKLTGHFPPIYLPPAWDYTALFVSVFSSSLYISKKIPQMHHTPVHTSFLQTGQTLWWSSCDYKSKLFLVGKCDSSRVLRSLFGGKWYD